MPRPWRSRTQRLISGMIASIWWVTRSRVAGPQVEAVGGLIEHQDLGVVHQGPGQQLAAPLAIGELPEGPLHQFGEPELLHQLPHPPLLLCPLPAA